MTDDLVNGLAALQALHGWCSSEKARAMAELVLRERPAVAVEIGVFGGRSLLAQALALREVGSGVIHGIDPWTVAASLEGTQEADNANWWAELDLPSIHDSAMAAISAAGVWRHVRILATTSDVAAAAFPPASIDVLHIDGNHSEEVSCRDVASWIPRVRPGGWLWLDDVDWRTTRRAVAMADAWCERVEDFGSCRLYRRT